MKKYLAFLTCFFFISLVSAIKVGVYLEPRDRAPESYCLSVAKGGNAFEVLSKINFLEFESFGDQNVLCGIDSDVSFICDSSSDRSLRTILQNRGVFGKDPIPSYDAGEECADESFNYLLNFLHYSFETHTFSNAHYCAKQGDVLGIINEARPDGQPGEPDFSYTPSFDEICEPLKIDDMEVRIGESEIRGVDDDGGKINGVFAGKTLELEFNVKNIALEFSRELRDLEIEGSLDLEGEDLKDSSDASDLEFGDKDSVFLKFDIPAETNSGKYDLTISLSGEDDRGNSYETEESYDVYIENLQIINVLYAEEDVGKENEQLNLESDSTLSLKGSSSGKIEKKSQERSLFSLALVIFLVLIIILIISLFWV